MRYCVASCINIWDEETRSITSWVRTAGEAEDYSGVRDPDAFRSFQLATAYCLTCSEDSSEGIMIPPGSVSWLTSRTRKTTTPRATARTVVRTRRQTNRWSRMQPLHVKLSSATSSAGAAQ